MSIKWTAAMDAELTRRRAEGQSFAQIAVTMHCPKNVAIARAKRLGLDPTDWSSPDRFYELKPIKHSPRKPHTTYAEKRVQNIVTHAEPEPPPPPPFRSPIQDAWPLTMCGELPLSLDREYEPVN